MGTEVGVCAHICVHGVGLRGAYSTWHGKASISRGMRMCVCMWCLYVHCAGCDRAWQPGRRSRGLCGQCMCAVQALGVRNMYGMVMHR
jgi:hypothetical protein